MERNEEEPKGFHNMVRKIKGPWKDSRDLSVFSSFPCMQPLHAHISALMCKGGTPLQLSGYIPFSFGPWDTESHKSRRKGGKAGLERRWEIKLTKHLL